MTNVSILFLSATLFANSLAIAGGSKVASGLKSIGTGAATIAGAAAAGAATSAAATVGTEMATDTVMGSTSVVHGKTLMSKTCGTVVGATLCVVGGLAIVAGVQNLFTASGRSASADPISSNYGGGYGNIDPSTGLPSGTPQFIADEYKDAQAIAQKYGMDLSNPASIEAYAKKNGVDINALKSGGADGDGSAGGIPMLTPELKEAMEKAKEDMLSKMKVAGIPFDESGGGAGGVGRGSSDDPNLKDLLASLNPDGAGGRNPASVDGLQKSLGGQPIGVASDNIFKLVSRRYQSKIQSNLFLKDPGPMTKKGGGL